MTDSTFQSLGLADELLAAITAAGYSTPTPIQAQSIPPLLAGKDLLGLAETGTGKTAAFTLPILQTLAKIPEPVAPRCCRALILAPTRELAIQIGESVEIYGKNLKLRHTVIFGGVGARPQVRAMDRGVDILIATPGRLLDLMSTRNVRLDRVQFLVLDEADRMLDMGFIRDVRRVIKEVPKVRQSLLFSATMPQDISALANEILHHPVRVEVARAGKTVDRIEQFVHFVDTKGKRAVLAALLKDEAMSRVIVFTRTKHGADRVARGLGASGVGAYAIHGNKSQNARQAALESFRNGKARVLVATDIAARGIDIDEISHVVNFDIPNIPESYVHRIGRTARAGHTGIAIALCAPEERAYLRDIERLTRIQLTQAPAIAGLAEIAASLPPVPTKSPNSDEGQNFERGRGQLHGRRHVPRGRTGSTWREGDAEGPIEAGGFNAQRERDGGGRGGDRSGPPRGHDRDRHEHAGRGQGGRPHGGRPQSGRPHEDRPREGRPQGGRPQGDRDDRRGGRPDSGGSGGERGARPTHRNGERPAAGSGRDASAGERPRFERREGEPRQATHRGPRRDDRAPRGPESPRGEGHRDGAAPQGVNGSRQQQDRSSSLRPGAGERSERRDRDVKPDGRAPRTSGPNAARGAADGRKPWQNSGHEGGRSERFAKRGDDQRREPRGPDARPPNRWTAERPRGGDQPRPAARDRAKGD